MSDTYNSLIVVLETNISLEEVQRLAKTITLLKGVLEVTNNVADHSYFLAETRVRFELRKKLFEVLGVNYEN